MYTVWMSQYYKPHRRHEWNFGGPNWTLSRSKIDLFMECQRCFYIDNKLGVARPPGFPFNLNSAVDALLKKEFDAYRAHGMRHPLAEKYGLDAIPLRHERMDEWRDALKRGIQTFHAKTGLTVRGGVDDLWVNTAGEIIVIDYKATSKEGTIASLEEEWHRGYKRQLEIYQWLLRQNGFAVSDIGYWVYANATKDREAFDARLDFELTLIPYTGSTGWIDDALIQIRSCLDSDAIPAAALDCDYCAYREAAGAVESKLSAIQPIQPVPRSAARSARKVQEPPQPASLF